jgi:hypothetical protein
MVGTLPFGGPVFGFSGGMRQTGGAQVLLTDRSGAPGPPNGRGRA